MILFVMPAMFANAATNNYLILEDIGIYKLFTGIQGQAFSGPPSKYSQTNTAGVLAGADHFSENDVSYDASYTEPSSKWPFVEVEVTQHAGADSDKWLLHELDKSFRTSLGIPGKDYGQRKINGQPILEAGYRIYRWLSGNKIINIEYTADDQNKPEPLEVVQAYLAKFPSTITSITLKELRSEANVTNWIKDEMGRRLWLCDKWSMQLQLGKVTQADMLSALVKNMKVFLNYRQKYFGVTADDDLSALQTYLLAKDGTSIKNKLTEYKTWWAKHKEKGIRL
jgi:hypothetical protein